MLIASRALQGIGAALVSPAALAIVNTTFPGGDDQRKALSLFAALSAGGAAVGLLLGGILTQALSWPWIFFVNVPIGVLAIPLALRFVPGDARRGRPTGGPTCSARSAITGGLALLIYAIVRTQADGWGSASTLVLGGIAIVLIVAFVVIEARVRASARAAADLPDARARDRRRGDVLPRRRDVRELLLRHALPPGDPALRARSRPGSRSCPSPS